MDFLFHSFDYLCFDHQLTNCLREHYSIYPKYLDSSTPYHTMRNASKRAIVHFADNVDPDQRAHMCSPIWAFSVHRHILQYPPILYATTKTQISLRLSANYTRAFSCVANQYQFLKSEV